MDPKFPDLVGQWANEEARRNPIANDNLGWADDLSDPFLWIAARAHIDATRVW